MAEQFHRMAALLLPLLFIVASSDHVNTTEKPSYDQGDLDVRQEIEVDNFSRQARFWLEQSDNLCLMRRRPKLLSLPALYFYSTKTVDGGVRIALNLTAEMYNGENNDFGLKAVQEQEIKQKLLLTNLYNKDLSTYFIIHGFLGSSNDSWMNALKDRILEAGEANVFLVDWSGGSRPEFIFDYGLAVKNSVEVVRFITAFIKNLFSSTETDNFDSLHLIGYSLGAQMAGLIGYQLDGNVGRITALDPAGPCFHRITRERTSLNSRMTGYFKESIGPSNRRLSASSAKLVVAIHSDIQLLGLNENCAHYDVYMNGGAEQLNCTDTQIGCNHDACLRLLLPPAPVIRSSESQSEESGNNEGEIHSDNKCYLMAYQCSSWQAYQAGECAYCNDNDARCIFTGLSLGRYPYIKTDPNLWQGPGLDRSGGLHSIIESNPDLIFNDEINPSAPNQLIDHPIDIRDSARHFTKVGIASTICLYQYQVLIATDSISNRTLAQDTKFHLEIPLEPRQSPLSVVSGRLVQVSHLISDRYNSKSALEESLSRQTGYPIPNDSLDYYTALITFNSTSNCNEIQQSDRILCKPLGDLSRIQLYSSGPEELRRVQYIALNYLSGLNKSIRDTRSQLLRPEPGVEVLETEQPSRDRLRRMISRPQEVGCEDTNCDLFGYQLNIVPPNFLNTI